MLEEKEDILGKIEDVNNQLKSKEREAAERKKKYMADLKEQVSIRTNSIDNGFEELNFLMFTYFGVSGVSEMNSLVGRGE